MTGVVALRLLRQVRRDRTQSKRSHPELRVSKFPIPFALFEQELEWRAFTFQNASQTPDVLSCERLEQESLVFFNKGDLRAAANAKFFPEFRGNYDLALRCDG